jgi:hypothetical protein
MLKILIVNNRLRLIMKVVFEKFFPVYSTWLQNEFNIEEKARNKKNVYVQACF